MDLACPPRQNGDRYCLLLSCILKPTETLQSPLTPDSLPGHAPKAHSQFGFLDHLFSASVDSHSLGGLLKKRNLHLSSKAGKLMSRCWCLVRAFLLHCIVIDGFLWARERWGSQEHKEDEDTNLPIFRDVLVLIVCEQEIEDLYMCAQFLWEPEGGDRVPGAGIIGDCEPPNEGVEN